MYLSWAPTILSAALDKATMPGHVPSGKLKSRLARYLSYISCQLFLLTMKGVKTQHMSNMLLVKISATIVYTGLSVTPLFVNLSVIYISRHYLLEVTFQLGSSVWVALPPSQSKGGQD